MRWAASNARAAKETKREMAKLAKGRGQEDAQIANKETKEGGDKPKPVKPSRVLVQYFQQNQDIDRAKLKRKADEALTESERSKKRRLERAMPMDDTKARTQELEGRNGLKRKADDDDDAEVWSRPAKRPCPPKSVGHEIAAKVHIEVSCIIHCKNFEKILT